MEFPLHAGVCSHSPLVTMNKEGSDMVDWTVSGLNLRGTSLKGIDQLN